MNGLLKECVQDEIDKTRWMVGGTHRRESAGGAENGAKKAGDVGVQDAGRWTSLRQDEIGRRS